jgi:activator of 2-hydroxyglutaryl-CoA dehydratase
MMSAGFRASSPRSRTQLIGGPAVWRDVRSRSVQQLERNDGSMVVGTDKGAYQTKAVLIAAEGVSRRALSARLRESPG